MKIGRKKEELVPDSLGLTGIALAAALVAVGKTPADAFSMAEETMKVTADMPLNDVNSMALLIKFRGALEASGHRDYP